jgi:hypothetical protein
MNRTPTILNAALLIAVCAWEVPSAMGADARSKVPVSALWRDRGDVAALDLAYGSGGKEHQPVGPFTFLKEVKEGTSPKFEVVDARGTRWKAKLGEETKAETAASHLLWAVGYSTDDDYYIADLRVENMPRLARGREFVSADGTVHEVRFERIVKGQKKTGNWDWFKNPFVGTREMNGLKVMMALMNNWDLKELNNAVYERVGAAGYAISDLGATFGQTGNTLVRSKSNLDEYRGSEFIQKVGSEEVDFNLSSRPLVPLALNVPYYLSRTKMQGIVKDIPISHAKWVGRLLGRLSSAQIRDCFRSAGYSPGEVEGFAVAVEGRIAELNNL